MVMQISNVLYQHTMELLANFEHPTLKRNLVALKALHKVEIQQGVLNIELKLPFPWQKGLNDLKKQLDPHLRKTTNCHEINWRCNYDVATLKRANNVAPVKGVKNIIAVSSGKGGVGKSAVSVNLSLALHRIGAKVGILDADIYGSSVPLMLGQSTSRPTSPDNKHMSPIKAYGIVANSMGFLTDPDNPMVWRGPVASNALLQILNETLWAENAQELDYLIIDMPPGTGDIQLTLAQQVPVTSAIVVTTPQDVALVDAMKGVQMFRKVGVPVLGIVENMAMHICSNCGHMEHIFGSGGAEKMAGRYKLQVLAHLPLNIKIRKDLDQGCPTALGKSNDELAEHFIQLAQQVATDLYWQGQVIPSEILIKEI